MRQFSLARCIAPIAVGWVDKESDMLPYNLEWISDNMANYSQQYGFAVSQVLPLVLVLFNGFVKCRVKGELMGENLLHCILYLILNIN